MVSLVVNEDGEVVSANVDDEVDGGTMVMVVSVAVDCKGVVWTVVVCKGTVVEVVVGNGIVENDPMVCDVVRSGVVNVRCVEKDVLVVEASVKSLPTHNFTIRLPRCASLNSVSAELLTSWHWSSMLSSICLIPEMQEREQVSPLVKSAVVQPVMAVWYTRLQAMDSKPS